MIPRTGAPWRRSSPGGHERCANAAQIMRILLPAALYLRFFSKNAPTFWRYASGSAV